jgi:hypothetical protein
MPKVDKLLVLRKMLGAPVVSRIAVEIILGSCGNKRRIGFTKKNNSAATLFKQVRHDKANHGQHQKIA